MTGSHGDHWLEKSLGNSETGVVTGSVCPHLSERGATSDNSWQEGLTYLCMPLLHPGGRWLPAPAKWLAAHLPRCPAAPWRPGAGKMQPPPSACLQARGRGEKKRLSRWRHWKSQLRAEVSLWGARLVYDRSKLPTVKPGWVWQTHSDFWEDCKCHWCPVWGAG